MSDEATAPVSGGSEPAPVVTPGNADLAGGDYSVADALASLRKKSAPDTNSTAESAPAATADKESVVEADAAPRETEATSETQETDPPEVAPLDLPRSWTKDQADHWNALPRSTQEYLIAQASKDSEAVRRSQNEAAELRKAAEAERAKAEQVRKDYEAKLPLLEKRIQTVGPFVDIQTMDDVKKLQREDPFRFQEYQVHIWEEQAQQAELAEARSRQSAEQKAAWAEFTRAESKALGDYVSESDIKTYSPKAGEYLLELGFKDSELAAMSNGEKFSPFDHRFQRLIYNAMKYSEVKAAPIKAIPKPVPAVQKPGVGRAPGAASADNIQASREKLNSSGSVEDAFALYQAKRRAS
jgi:hypothetical protein